VQPGCARNPSACRPDRSRHDRPPVGCERRGVASSSTASRIRAVRGPNRARSSWLQAADLPFSPPLKPWARRSRASGIGLPVIASDTGVPLRHPRTEQAARGTKGCVRPFAAITGWRPTRRSAGAGRRARATAEQFARGSCSSDSRTSSTRWRTMAGRPPAVHCLGRTPFCHDLRGQRRTDLTLSALISRTRGEDFFGRSRGP
jgi:hypothetical protein